MPAGFPPSEPFASIRQARCGNELQAKQRHECRCDRQESRGKSACATVVSGDFRLGELTLVIGEEVAVEIHGAELD
ncbi:MAG: hypothetical protein ACRD4O_08385, partial [Bryobacteraceae bacterium]